MSEYTIQDIFAVARRLDYGGYGRDTTEYDVKVMKQVESALKLQELVIDMENQTGRSLVDVQNWLSKEGKLSTEVINKVLRDLINDSQTTLKEEGKAE